MVISLSDGKVIFATSLLGEFTLTLCSFSQIPSFSKTIILSRKWGNICKCGSCLGLLLTLARPHPHTLLCMKELPGWGKLSKGPRFKARTGCRAGPERRARPARISAVLLSLASPHLSSPSPRQEASCKRLDEKETLGHQVPPPYFESFCVLMRKHRDVTGLFLVKQPAGG